MYILQGGINFHQSGDFLQDELMYAKQGYFFRLVQNRDFDMQNDYFDVKNRDLKKKNIHP